MWRSVWQLVSNNNIWVYFLKVQGSLKCIPFSFCIYYLKMYFLDLINTWSLLTRVSSNLLQQTYILQSSESKISVTYKLLSSSMWLELTSWQKPILWKALRQKVPNCSVKTQKTILILYHNPIFPPCSINE